MGLGGYDGRQNHRLRECCAPRFDGALGIAVAGFGMSSESNGILELLVAQSVLYRRSDINDHRVVLHFMILL